MSIEEKLVADLRHLARKWGAAEGPQDGRLAVADEAASAISRLSAEVQELREALCRAEERFSQIETAGFSQTRQSTTDLLLYARSLAADGSIRARAALKPETVNG